MTASFPAALSQSVPQQQRSGWQLRAPTVQRADTVAGWSCSADEAQRWVSNAVHPFPASAVTGWWDDTDVQPWLLVDPQDLPVAYGEVAQLSSIAERILRELDPERHGHADPALMTGSRRRSAVRRRADRIR